MDKKLIPIGQAAQMIGISIDTLRRWDKRGSFLAVKINGRRFYRKSDIDNYLVKLYILEADIFNEAINWVLAPVSVEPKSIFYCSNMAVFQHRLNKLQKELGLVDSLRETFPLITSIAGEIGSNSFDHNLGKWHDIPGIFFGYDLERKEVVLADRGQGVLATLRRVKPELVTDEEALDVAFTEIISGRSPESRGNGLKYVKNVILDSDITLHFQSGSAVLEIKKGDKNLNVTKANVFFRGCIALIKY